MEFKNWNFPSGDLRPVSFPFWMAQAIALDLEEKLRLEHEVQLLVLEKETLEYLVTGLKQKDYDRLLQLELSEKNRRLLEVQLKAEREIKKGDSWMLWSLRLLGVLGAGFLLGRILEYLIKLRSFRSLPPTAIWRSPPGGSKSGDSD